MISEMITSPPPAPPPPPPPQTSESFASSSSSAQFQVDDVPKPDKDDDNDEMIESTDPNKFKEEEHEFEPDLETESDTETDTGTTEAAATATATTGEPRPSSGLGAALSLLHQGIVVKATTTTPNGQATEEGETLLENGQYDASSSDGALPPSPPPPCPPNLHKRGVSLGAISPDTSTNAVFWEELRKHHVAAGSNASKSAVKVELEELRRKKLAKSLLIERSISEAAKSNQELFSASQSPPAQAWSPPPSTSSSSTTAAYLSEIEFYLNQRARSNELKRKEQETMDFIHSYRNKNVEESARSSPGRHMEDSRRHSYTPTASPFLTSPPPSSRMKSLMMTGSSSELFPLATTLEESIDKADGMGQQGADDMHLANVGMLREDFERQFSPRTQRSIRKAISRQRQLDKGGAGDQKKWDEKVGDDCPQLPFTRNGGGAAAVGRLSPEKKSRRQIASERKKKKEGKSKVTTTAVDRKVTDTRSNVAKREAQKSSTITRDKDRSSKGSRSPKKKSKDSNIITPKKQLLSSTNKNKQSAKKESRNTASIRSSSPKKSLSSSTTQQSAKKAEQQTTKQKKIKTSQTKSPPRNVVAGPTNTGQSKTPPRPPSSKKYFVPRCASIKKYEYSSSTTTTKSPNVSPLRGGSPLRRARTYSQGQSGRATPTLTTGNRRRCDSAPTTNVSSFPSSGSLSSLMSFNNTPAKKSVPLYNGRSIGVDCGAKRSALVCCERKWELHLHGNIAGCDRCLHFASDEEKKAFATKGHHHRIMMTRGGCHRSCTYFPRKRDELPARLCHKCFYDTHELKLW